MNLKRFLFLALMGICLSLSAWSMPEFSTAGFFEVPNTGREVYSMNLAWRFYKGKPIGNPAARGYDDSCWEVVAVPHGLEYLPVEASVAEVQHFVSCIDLYISFLWSCNDTFILVQPSFFDF